MKYIDSEKLIAEIERRIENGKDGYGGNLLSLLAFITSLQQEQPEEDLEKEIGRWMDSLDDKYCSFVEQYSIQDVKETARHFYELGLKARKE